MVGDGVCTAFFTYCVGGAPELKAARYAGTDLELLSGVCNEPPVGDGAALVDVSLELSETLVLAPPQKLMSLRKVLNMFAVGFRLFRCVENTLQLVTSLFETMV
jgi:hypothetical protein